MSTAMETRSSNKIAPAHLHKRTKSAWLVLFGVLATALVWLFPLYIAMANALKRQPEFVESGPLALPKGFDLTNLKDFWTATNFTEKLFNSFQISISVAVIAVALSFLTAYAIGIGRVKGRMGILAFFMVTFTIPQEAMVYPFYKVAKMLNLYDNKVSVILVFGVLSVGFGTYMLSSVLSTFPEEILESAKIDGAGPWRIMRSIVLPLMRPTLFVLATMFFIYTWNEFLIPMILLPSNENQTVTLAMGVTTGQFTNDPTARAAAAMVGFLPSVIFFLLFQRTMMRGITVGSVK